MKEKIQRRILIWKEQVSRLNEKLNQPTINPKKKIAVEMEVATLDYCITELELILNEEAVSEEKVCEHPPELLVKTGVGTYCSYCKKMIA